MFHVSEWIKLWGFREGEVWLPWKMLSCDKSVNTKVVIEWGRRKESLSGTMWLGWWRTCKWRVGGGMPIYIYLSLKIKHSLFTGCLSGFGSALRVPKLNTHHPKKKTSLASEIYDTLPWNSVWSFSSCLITSDMYHWAQIITPDLYFSKWMQQ